VKECSACSSNFTISRLLLSLYAAAEDEGKEENVMHANGREGEKGGELLLLL
jgi:hypothetical protein